MAKKTFYSTVPDRRLKSLVKNGRDYSKPTLNEQIIAARESLGKKKPTAWMKIVSVPMGGDEQEIKEKTVPRDSHRMAPPNSKIYSYE